MGYRDILDERLAPSGISNLSPAQELILHTLIQAGKDKHWDFLQSKTCKWLLLHLPYSKNIHQYIIDTAKKLYKKECEELSKTKYKIKVTDLESKYIETLLSIIQNSTYGIGLTQLTEISNIPSSSVKRVLKKMEEKQLVVKKVRKYYYVKEKENDGQGV